MKVEYFDNGKIQIWRGVTGWCFVTTNQNGEKVGGIGCGSKESALSLARTK